MPADEHADRPGAVPPPSLAQPVRAALTPGRRNVELTLEAASPGGTTVAQATYKRAASTPEGEGERARERRLDAERHRLWRARARLNTQLQQQRTISMRELDTALDALDKPDGADHDDWGAEALELRLAVSEQRRIEAHSKLQAAKHSCAVELAGVLEALTIEDAYALYPSSERPQYRSSDGQIFRPDDGSCACGSSSRFQCTDIEYNDGCRVDTLKGCESSPLRLVIRLEREQDGDEKVYGEFELERKFAQADAVLRASLGDESYRKHIRELEERKANTQVEREAAIRNWDVEHWRAETARGDKCKCAEYGILCNCDRHQKIGWQCGSVAALQMAASMRAQQQEAESALEAAALRVASADVERLRLARERVEQVRVLPRRREGHLVRKPGSEDSLHEKSMHLADRLMRALPGVLISESAHAMAVYRRVSPHELILGNWDGRIGGPALAITE
uniref:Uncharacterized protein n=1 Tax=Coccolithus braarudii TaxID=221442 RepID=A0A7S0Q4M2_9EUKA